MNGNLCEKCTRPLIDMFYLLHGKHVCKTCYDAENGKQTAVLSQEIERLTAENVSLRGERDMMEAEIHRLTHGGCGKPGHTTASSDEGTCYCLTCHLEAENAAIKAETDRWHVIANDLAEALERLNALYQSEQDADAPTNRPQWLAQPLGAFIAKYNAEGSE